MCLVRISKLLAQRGVCSRREADEYIKEGLVMVNDRVVQLGEKVTENQKIDLNNQIYSKQIQKYTILMNKPVGYVCHSTDKNYPTVFRLIQNKNLHQKIQAQIDYNKIIKDLAPAGRLDIDSQGLLILTQDGQLAKSIIQINSSIEKEYIVQVKGEIDEQKLEKLRYGLFLDEKQLKPAKIKSLHDNQINFILQEGKKRQIRRMCQLVGLQVINLKRIRIGNIHLNDLPLGKWRFLDKNFEI